MSSLLLAALAPAFGHTDANFSSTIARVEQMVHDSGVRAMAARHGLDLVNVTWEDTGRSKGSSVGPNISDMTIGVRDGNGQLHPMPVLRFDNFTDKTADVRIDDLYLRVGNATGDALRPVTLAEVLHDTRGFLHDPASWAGSRRSLLADRDTHVLVSAQACFLPIPQSGAATFTPVLYNYQSYPGSPAVLTMVATREGTSIQVVENRGGYLSEVLSFNDDGERAPFTAERLTDFRASNGAAAASEPGLDMVMVIQVPLVQAPRPAPAWDAFGYGGGGLMMESAAAPMASAKAMERSDVEVAVIGHGPTEGAYEEIGGLAIQRDTRFPVRVTVQFYRATSNGVVSEKDIADLRRQIDRVYADADYVGSLVTGGYTGRPTELGTPRASPTASWADPFWSWHTTN
jgi:hypothetical protein